MSFLDFEFEEGNQMKIKGWGKEKKNNYIHLCMNVMSMKCLYKTCQIRIWLYRLYPMYKIKNSKIINCLKKNVPTPLLPLYSMSGSLSDLIIIFILILIAIIVNVLQSKAF